MKAKKFVSWRRVSTQKQGSTGLGLQAQKDMIDYFVNAEGGELIADFSEVHTGTDLMTCKELRKAIDFCNKMGATLIVAKHDRFRRVEQALFVYEELAGRLFLCDVPNCDKFTITLFWAIAEREALLTSIRTKSALKVAKANGKRLGRPDIATANDARIKASEAKKENARQRIDPKTWAFVRLLMEKGLTCNAIANELNKAGYKTTGTKNRRGGEFRGNQVKRMIEIMMGETATTAMNLNNILTNS